MPDSTPPSDAELLRRHLAGEAADFAHRAADMEEVSRRRAEGLSRSLMHLNQGKRRAYTEALCALQPGGSSPYNFVREDGEIAWDEFKEWLREQIEDVEIHLKNGEMDDQAMGREQALHFIHGAVEDWEQTAQDNEVNV